MTLLIYRVHLASTATTLLSLSIPRGQLYTSSREYQPNGKRHIYQSYPIILITGDKWNPSEEILCPERQSRKSIEMRTIKSLTSGMTRRQIRSVTMENEARTQIERYGETDIELGKITCVYDMKDFCDHLISAVIIATMYCDDIDQWNEERRVSSIISNERHSKVTPEELASKWNVGLQTAKDTIRVMTQCGIRTAVHPMMRCVQVDHLNLLRQQLKGTWFTDITLKGKIETRQYVR